jgi:tight adherence protein B
VSGVVAVIGLTADGVGLAVISVGAVVLAAFALRSQRERKRLRSYNRNLLRVLDAIAMSLRSGAGLPNGIREAAVAREGVVENDLREVARQLDFGVAFDDALAVWSRRTPLRSVKLTVACIGLAHRTGGSSAQGIAAVRTTVRNAMNAEASILVHAAQARASATVLACLPVALSGPMMFFNETARHFMLHTPVGLTILVIGLVLDVLGLWWMSVLISRTQS